MKIWSPDPAHQGLSCPLLGVSHVVRANDSLPIFVTLMPKLPVPKLIKGVGPSLHIVRIAPYEQTNPIARKITKKLVSLPSLVVFYCVVTRL